MSDVANHYYGTIALDYDEERGSGSKSLIIPKDTPSQRKEDLTIFPPLVMAETVMRVRDHPIR